MFDVDLVLNILRNFNILLNMVQIVPATSSIGGFIMSMLNHGAKLATVNLNILLLNMNSMIPSLNPLQIARQKDYMGSLQIL